MATQLHPLERAEVKTADVLPEDVLARIAVIQRGREATRRAYEEFFDRARSLSPVDLATAWLQHEAQHSEKAEEREAIAYLSHRGCLHYVRHS